MNVIKLTSHEIMSGSFAGLMRHVENLKKGRKDFHGASKDVGWQINIEGCLGEMALSKFLGVYWQGKGTFRGADVGEYDCRTSSRDNGDLILHPNDPDNRIFWLVTGRNGEYVIQGWIKASEGKNQKYWRDPAGGRPAFFVPQSVLNPPHAVPVAA